MLKSLHSADYSSSKQTQMFVLGLVLSLHFGAGVLLAHMDVSQTVDIQKITPIEVSFIEVAKPKPVVQEVPEPVVSKTKPLHNVQVNEAQPAFDNPPPTPAAPKPTSKMEMASQEPTKPNPPKPEIAKIEPVPVAPKQVENIPSVQTNTVVAVNNLPSASDFVVKETVKVKEVDKAQEMPMASNAPKANPVSRAQGPAVSPTVSNTVAQEAKKDGKSADGSQDNHKQTAQHSTATAKDEQKASSVNVANEKPKSTPPANVQFSVGEVAWEHKPILSYDADMFSPRRKEVEVTYKVNQHGDVESVHFSTGDRDLDRLLRNQLKKAKFKPFIREGQAVSGTVTVSFRL